MNIVGPFPGQRFKVQTMAMNRSRPSISVNFNIPFNGLCHGMQVMHRSGFSVTNLNAGYVSDAPQQPAKTSNDLTAENLLKSVVKTASPKRAEANRETKEETVKKSEKKSSQRNRRQRRK